MSRFDDAWHVEDYSKNPCPWDIGTISNLAAEAWTVTGPYGLVTDHASACLVGDCADLPRAWVLAFIPQPKHDCSFINTSIWAQNWWQIHEKAAQPPWLAALTELVHEHTHYSSHRLTCTGHGKSSTYWSVLVLSKIYYVLPTLFLCHLSQIIKANLRNMQLAMFSVCCVFFSLRNSKYGSHMTRSHAEDCRMRPEIPEASDNYRTNHHLAWEIVEILKAWFATQKATSRGIKCCHSYDNIIYKDTDETFDFSFTTIRFD